MQFKRSWWSEEDEEKWQEKRKKYIEGFTSLPNKILLSDDLSSDEKMYLLVLLLFDFKKDGIIFPGNELLGRILHEDYRNVSTKLNRLHRRGLIVVLRRGSNKSHIIDLTPLREFDFVNSQNHRTVELPKALLSESDPNVTLCFHKENNTSTSPLRENKELSPKEEEKITNIIPRGTGKTKRGQWR